MAQSPRRFFTTPLGSGRSTTLGQADPRARRDNNARVTSVDDPFAGTGGLTATEVQALIDTSLAAAPVTETIVESPLTLEQGVYDFDGVATFYVSYGADGNWEAFEQTASTNKTTGAVQSGTKPTTTAEFVTKTYYDADA